MKAALVLLPGMDGTGKLFAPLVTALGSDIPAVVVRYPDEPLDYAAHEALALAALPSDRPYVILGESFSGPIAISLAARAPPGLVGYVLCASFIRSPLRFLRWLNPLLALMPPQRVPESLAAYFLMGRFGSGELRAMHTAALRGVSARTLVARLKAIANVDVGERLRNVRVPGLYLRATEDRLVSLSAARAYLRLASNGRVTQIEGPHFLLQARPEAAAHAIREFMSKVCVAATEKNRCRDTTEAATAET